MIRILGIDLAWGERKPDGVCAIHATRGTARILDIDLVAGGDAALLEWAGKHAGDGPALVAVDGPLICPNTHGSRPVDRRTHEVFGRHHAGAYPANRSRCPRPPRIGAELTNLGFRPGWGLGGADGELRLAIEVYPHPAMVRLFDIEERIPYKKGRAADRRRHFQELQGHLRRCLDAHFPKLERSDGLEELLDQPWSKPVEDRIDAVFCALIGYWHWLHVGRRSEVLGDLYTGFILVPKP